MEPVISSQSLAVRLGGKTILDDISFVVNPGQMVGIIGPNGAGKTTLLRAILGLVSISAGELQVLGQPVSRINGQRSRIGYMPQRLLFERHFPLTVGDAVATGLLTRSTVLKQIKGANQKVLETLDLVGMGKYRLSPFQELSGGQQQRILLARSLVRKPELLLLDEPNAGLDFPAQQKFIDLLKQLRRQQNLTVVLVSHDLVSVAAVADSLICIDRRMHLHGRPGEVLRSHELHDAYRCEFDYLSTAFQPEEESK
jgi:zinc transport system ATP-binding protein